MLFLPNNKKHIIYQITDLTVQQELSDRRADRLDKRVTELLESRTAFQTRERELTLELKQLEQKCADIEAKVTVMLFFFVVVEKSKQI